MNDEAQRELIRAVNNLSTRLLITGITLEEVIGRLPESERTAIAANLRLRVDEVLSNYSPSAAADETATLQLAAYLEAAGHPPKR